MGTAGTGAADGLRVEEASAIDVLTEVGPYTVATSDPPWSTLAGRVPPPKRVVLAADMEVSHLESLLADEPADGVVAGLGGGSALDTAKFLAWRTGKPLLQIPTIASVDAVFTDAVGVRDERRVRYIGQVLPELVVVDLPLIRSAPPRLNRAGIGDILSCHTGLEDWRRASAAGQGVPWDAELADLGQRLLTELDEAASDIRAVSDGAIRFLIDAYRRIGAACARAGHSRFEEGSEHFLAYAFEHATGRHQVHGELVSLCVTAMSTLQEHEPQRVVDLITRAGASAHPLDLGIDEATFTRCLLDLPAYVRAEEHDWSVVDERGVDHDAAARLWTVVSTLPRAVG